VRVRVPLADLCNKLNRAMPADQAQLLVLTQLVLVLQQLLQLELLVAQQLDVLQLLQLTAIWSS
jgi:hypothetical protein